MYEKLRAFLVKQNAKSGSKKAQSRAEAIRKKKVELLADILSRMNAVVGAIFNIGNDPRYYKQRVAEALAKPNLSILGDDDFAVETFCQLLSPNYDPPSDPIELRTDLEILFEFYLAALPRMKEIPPHVASDIDLVMTRVACAAAECIWAGDDIGEKEDMGELRKRGIEAKKSRAAQEARTLFYTSIVNLKTMKTIHKIATAIHTHLKGKHDAFGDTSKLPSKVTICRYLLEDNEIRAELKKHRMRIPASLF
jgi:hypothetical protein